MAFKTFGCVVSSDRRKVSGRVPCRMVSESRKMFYKSVSSVPGSDRLEVPLHFRADSLRPSRSLSPSAMVQGATIPAQNSGIKSAVWSYSIFDDFSCNRLILKYYVFYILGCLRI